MRIVKMISHLVIFVTLWCGIASANTLPIIVGDDHAYPPFSFSDQDGNPSGFSIDLIRAVADVLGWEIEIQLGPWGEVRHKLASGEIDMIAGMLQSASREERFAFSTRHSVASGDVFTRLDLRVSKLTDLQNRRVVVQRNDIIHEYLVEQDLGIDFVIVDNVPDALRLVSSGEEDFAAVLFMPGYYTLHEYSLDNLRGNNLQINPADYCFAVQRDDENLKLMLNQGLNIVKATGRYDEIYDKWLGVFEQQQVLNWKKSTRALFTIAVVVLIWALILQYIVRLRTADLTKSNFSLSKSREELRAAVLQLTATTDQLVGQYNQLQLMEKALSEEKDLLKTTLLSVGEGVVVTDCSGLVIMINPIAQKLTGWAEMDAIGKSYQQLFPGDYAHVVEQVLYTEQVVEVEELTLQTNERKSTVAMTVAPILDQEGFIRGAVGVIRDITEATEQKREIEYLSFHDHLTGLVNRRGFTKEVVNYDVESNLPLAVIFGDVNGLKIINDAFGHLQGDELLIRVANILRFVAPDPNLVVRLGGDEFVLVLPQTDLEQAKEKVAEIQKLAQGENIQGIPISIALGVAVKSRLGQDFQDCFNQAEKEMYQDKSGGKGR